MFLTQVESDALETLVAGIEARTGVQVVTAVVGKSDTYDEVPWKAFALGASIAGFVVGISDVLRPQWIPAGIGIVHAVIILAAAGAAALLATLAPTAGRLLVRSHRAELEVRQHARSLFLERELFRTRGRTAVLVFVSLFERRIEILADTGLHARVSEAEWHAVIDGMKPELRDGRPFPAFQHALAAIEALLVGKGVSASAAGPNELPDRAIEERGV